MFKRQAKCMSTRDMQDAFEQHKGIGKQTRLTISDVVEVDVGVTEGAAGDGITADTDRGNRADRVEHLEQHSLVDGGVELTNVERGRGGGGSGRDRGKVGSLGSLGLGGSNLLLLLQAQVVGGSGGDGGGGSGLDVSGGNGGGHIGFFVEFFLRKRRGVGPVSSVKNPRWFFFGVFEGSFFFFLVFF
jgi:hypothetical protein